jgi:hypothetical protein
MIMDIILKKEHMPKAIFKTQIVNICISHRYYPEMKLRWNRIIVPANMYTYVTWRSFGAIKRNILLQNCVYMLSNYVPVFSDAIMYVVRDLLLYTAHNRSQYTL